jgi:UDP-N-acetylmuramoyl-tripeptide--D-alanyl-D-alanine ligase
MRLDLAELAKAAGGKLLRGEPGTVVDSFAIDTRKLSRGGAFFALCGTRTDGHEFLTQAERQGAAVAIIDHEPKTDGTAPPATILVDDTTLALGRCGVWARRKKPDVHWVAVTGSNGKTTTKEMIAEALSADRKVHRTPGNLNNHLGVPLTLLALPDDAQVAVVELAMSGHGEIADLTRMTDPDIGLVTNVRAVHMSSFASLDDVAAAKGEMFAVLRDNATAVVNLDDAQLRVQSTRHIGPQVTFGQAPAAQLRLEQIDNRFVPGATLQFSHDGRSRRLRLRIGGAHSAHNALAALAVAHASGVDLEIAAERICSLEAGPGRGQVHNLSRGMLLVDDSYNSSPPALAAVLETLRLSEPAGRRVLVFGDMLELGPMGAALHREAGRRAATAGVQLLMAVGPMSRETAESARRAGVGEVHYHADSKACAESILEYLSDGDLILVKGSRGMRMERVVESLCGHEEER